MSDDVEEGYPLTFTQHQLMVLSTVRSRPVDFTQSFVLERRLSREELRATLARLVQRQDALRYEIVRGGTGGVQRPRNAAPEPLFFHDVDADADSLPSPLRKEVEVQLDDERLDPHAGRMFIAGAIASRVGTEVFTKTSHVVHDLASVRLLPGELAAAAVATEPL